MTNNNTKIRIMKHHLEHIADFREIPEESKERYRESWDNIYGKGTFDGVVNWAKGLDPKTTIVQVLNDKDKSGKVNIDDVCMLTPKCKYLDDCSKSSLRTLFRIIKEKPSRFIKTLYSAVWNRIYYSMLYEFEDGKEYPLKEIINLLGKRKKGYGK